MRVLVIAGDRLGEFDPITANGVTAGLLLGEVTVLTAGPNAKEKASLAAGINGVQKVLCATHPTRQQSGVETLALLIYQLMDSYDAVLAATSTFGSDLIPRLAALSNRSPITGLSAIINRETGIRPIHAGAVLSTIKLPKPPLFLTVRPTAFLAARDRSEESPAPISFLEQSPQSPLSQTLETLPSPNLRPDPVTARVVVAGGGGLEKGGSFEWVEKLADRLEGAVGASRSAVDMGLASNDMQIGQTGRCIAPDLYIGLGISGAIQHLAGIKEARMIVSINTDPSAPLQSVADYSLTEDLFTAVPELLKITQ